jgi:hypothetical protein
MCGAPDHMFQRCMFQRCQDSSDVTSEFMNSLDTGFEKLLHREARFRKKAAFIFKHQASVLGQPFCVIKGSIHAFRNSCGVERTALGLISHRE